MVECDICGSEQAKWPLSSKQDSNGKPFFPFLDHHKASSDKPKKEKDGEYLVCNVCYSFLIQQWNTYEENGTPSGKRLYWLKHQTAQQDQHLGPDSLFFDTQSNVSEDEKQILYEQTMGSNSTGHVDSYQNDSIECVLEDSLSSAGAGKGEEKSSEATSESGITSDDQKVCLLCGNPTPVHSIKPVHTKPQLKKDTPFFPSLLSFHKDLNNKIDSQGRILSCEECFETLFLQWDMHSQKGTPISERKYVFGRSTSKPFVCFICGKNENSEATLLKCKMVANGEPFFPFLKNLRKPPGAEPINEANNVKCCNKCVSVLYSQWYDYYDAGIPVCDQLYSVVGKTKNLSSLLSLIHAQLPDDQQIVCIICHRREIRKEMKEVYSNPFANVDLSFLENIEKVSGSYFAKKLGQSLVCLSCYRNITCQWDRFDKRDIPFHLREYSLQRFEGNANCDKYSIETINEKIKCEICHTYVNARQTQELDFVPHHKEVDHHPFFPCLAKLKDSVVDREPKLIGCEVCSQNLMLQWHHYERKSKPDDDRWKRNYKPHHFVCFICGSAAHYSDVTLLDKKLIRSSFHEKPLLAVELNGMVVICLQCKDLFHSEKQERVIGISGSPHITSGGVNINETGDSTVLTNNETLEEDLVEATVRHRRSSPKPKDSKELIGMKVTATVPPLPSLVQRNQDTANMQNQSSGSRNDDEGSFAAALRKLAQQAIVPAARRPVNRERQTSPSGAFKSGPSSREAVKSPPRAKSSGHQVRSPFYPRANIHPSGISVSSVASIAPPSSAFDKEKTDLHVTSAFGTASGLQNELSSRRLPRPVVPGIFGRHEVADSSYRQSRDEVMLHGEKGSVRDPGDAVSMGHSGSGIVNGPSSGPLNILGVKDRGSNIGLVHPQPVRKLPDEDAVKSGLINGVRCNPIESPASLFRPPSPSDNFSRYQLAHGMHQHSGQGPCPVHGHESGHHHGSPRDHGTRPGRLPFEGITPRSGPLPDFRGIHSHHQRIRDEIYGMNRIPVERREGLQSHVLEEDMRRRGYDWPWHMQHPFYDGEQHRRHFVNGYRGSEHAYKDMVHGPHYFSPHLYYPPEYPYVDAYPHSSLAHSDMYANRYGSNQLSPRLADYYRRERSLSDRASERERSDSRRQGSASLKMDPSEGERRTADSMINENRGLDERTARRHEMSDYFASLSRDRLSCKDDIKDKMTVESITGNISSKRTSIENDEPKRKLRIMEKLDLIAKANDERGQQMNTIVVKEEPVTELSEDFAVEALPQDKMEHDEDRMFAEDSSDVMDVATEDMEKKADFMSCIGLISHGKKRVLEEDFERKRWERKVAKMRGRPRKRTRREQTDDSDGRPCSEIDFYNGPMTRHKQQLLQEQEMLLEQVQKNNMERNGVKDANGSLDSKNFLSSNSSSPTNSSITSTTPNSIGEPSFTTVPRSKRHDEDRACFGKSQSFKPYKDGDSSKDLVNGTRHFGKFEGLSSVRDCQELDGFVFGLPQLDVSAVKAQWSGIDCVARSFTRYENEREVKENLVRNTCDKLQYEREKLNQQRQQYQKDIMMLREKRGQLNDSIRRQQQMAKNLRHALVKLSSV